MPFTNPKTWALNEVYTSPDANTYVRDNIRYLSHNATGGAPTCRVYNSAAISLTNNTDTALTFDSERFDLGAMHDTVTNPSRITIPSGAPGKYFLSGHVQFASSAAGNRRQIALKVNGTTPIAIQAAPPISGVTHLLSVSTVYQLAVADYVELFALQDSGGALTVTVLAATSPEFVAIWMGE